MQEANAELQTAAAKLARAEAALEANAKSLAELTHDITRRLNELTHLSAKSEQEKKGLREVIDGLKEERAALERQQAALERQQGVLRAERDAALARRDALEAQFRGECVVVAW